MKTAKTAYKGPIYNERGDRINPGMSYARYLRNAGIKVKKYHVSYLATKDKI